jgi:Ulp1 protease family, C-terminal catalytic domain
LTDELSSFDFYLSKSTEILTRRGTKYTYLEFVQNKISGLPKDCHFLTPLNVTGTHYIAALVLGPKHCTGALVPQQYVYIFDSLRWNISYKDHWRSTKSIQDDLILDEVGYPQPKTYYKQLLVLLSQHLWSNENVPVFISDHFNLPRQPNLTDCGVYALEFIIRAFYNLPQFLYRVQPMAPQRGQNPAGTENQNVADTGSKDSGEKADFRPIGVVTPLLNEVKRNASPLFPHDMITRRRALFQQTINGIFEK